MVWDGLLLAVFLRNVLRSLRRGGRDVAMELGSFALTYATTFFAGPLLAAAVRDHLERPPPFASFLSILAVYVLVRRLLKLARTATAGDGETAATPSAHSTSSGSLASMLTGALLGSVRGSLVVAGIASLGFCLGIVQQAGALRGLPAAQASFAVSHAAVVVEFVTDRFTAGAGPTARLLFDVALRPEGGEGLRRFMESPFVARVKASDEARAFAGNPEVRGLLRDRRTAELLVHPAFLRVMQFSMNELRTESSSQGAMRTELRTHPPVASR